MINTVLGQISENDLGTTLPHEHIFINMRHCVVPTGSEPPIFYEKVTLENVGLMDITLIRDGKKMDKQEKEFIQRNPQYFRVKNDDLHMDEADELLKMFE